MINKNRIIPITSVDYLTLIGTMLAIANVTYSVLAASTVDGEFTSGTNNVTVLCDQPVKSLNFGSGVSAGTVYFVAGYNYEGIKVNGAAATIADGSVTVDKESFVLYKAVLSSGSVTITAVSPVAA